MSNTIARAQYADRLKRAMGSTVPEVTVRGLAKHMRPDGVESMRRLVRRFLKGERTPGPKVAGEIVAALRVLGADTSELEQDDDEDSDRMYRDLLDMAAQLEQIGHRLAERLRGAA